MKKPQGNQEKNASKSIETLAEACAFILLLLIASEADVAVGGSVVEVPLDHLSHFNPCSFNPLCVCSTGGRFFQSYVIKSAPWTILWFRILEIFSAEYIKRLCVFMFQTCSNSQLLRRVL